MLKSVDVISREREVKHYTCNDETLKAMITIITSITRHSFFL